MTKSHYFLNIRFLQLAISSITKPTANYQLPIALVIFLEAKKEMH